ncbi:uncharacterized protein [Salvelinus alpinus]|uniref:uncharacterized protein n=1 Tax=Salvelinus alpinus TaxID=8036 RepID=UPI0039FB8C12
MGENSVTAMAENSVTDMGENSVTAMGENSVKDMGENSVKDMGENSVTDIAENSVTDIVSVYFSLSLVSVPPSVDEFRQGTEKSQKTLVDIRSGRIIKPVGEMERSMIMTPQEPMEVPVQRRVGGWVRADVLPGSLPVEERRQGTEPSRRFLMDLNTGLVKEHVSEMDRRVAPVYTPSSVDEFRQGTENSQKTLVDIKSGHIIRPVGEMERSNKQIPQDETDSKM